MTTLADYRSQIRSIGNFPAGDTRITDTVIDREINRALKRIAMIHDWPWLQYERTINTNDVQQGYTLPDDFLRLVSLRYIDSNSPYNLSKRNIQEVDEVSGTGLSTIYAVWGGKVVLAPAPAGAYTLRLRYVAQEPVLVNDSDVPRIPDYWDNGLVEAALVELYRTAAKADDAVLAEQRFEMWVTETQKTVRQETGSLRIRVRPGAFI